MDLTPALQYGALGLLGIFIYLVLTGLWKILNRYTDQMITQSERFSAVFESSVKANTESVMAMRSLIASLEKHDERTSQAHEKVLNKLGE